MGFRRTANAIVNTPNIHFDKWMDEMRTNSNTIVSDNNVVRIAKTILRKADPKQFLLSHATIVASVDCYSPKEAKVGRFLNRDLECHRKFANFRIDPKCTAIINNNGDAWERSLLLSTYRTFIGAPNYLEHVQIPELSKGFIVDAIARDVGESCYIDILVATDRKHKILISDIMSENIRAMSMGCSVKGTPILLADGTTIPIEEIRPDMEVISQKGNICRVDNLQIRENRWSMRRIKVVGLTAVEFTDNHKFYCVPRHEIKTNYRHRLRRVVPDAYSFEYREAGQMKVGDVVATPILQGEVSTSLTLDEAKLLGLWVGDGWLHGKEGSSVGFCLDASPGIGEKISSFVEETLGKFSWRHGEMRMAVGCENEIRRPTKLIKRNAIYLTHRSHALRETIEKYVSGRTSGTKILSQDVMLWPKSHQLAFLAGVIDSDGCVSTTKRGTKQAFISTRNENLANQLLVILNRCGIIGTITKAKRSGTKMLPNAAGTDYQIRLRNSGVSEIPSEKIKASGGKFAKRNSGNSDRWIAGDHVYSVVKKIEEFDLNGFVYDFQVDNDHSYIANGIGVSNCISQFTICNKCGNVAVDETQICPCILYDGKGSAFFDEAGVEHKVSELIGHVTVPNSNQFIEASWVKNPAFVGAQRRNILNPDSKQIVSALESANNIYDIKMSDRDFELEGVLKSASKRIAEEEKTEDLSVEDEDAALDELSDDIGGESDSPDPDSADEEADASSDSADEPSGESPDKITTLLDQAKEMIVENLVNDIADSVKPKPEDVGTAVPGLAEANLNDTLLSSWQTFNKGLRQKFHGNPKLIKWASNTYKTIHLGGKTGIIASGLTPKDLIVFSWINDIIRSRSHKKDLYKVAINVGPSKIYPSKNSYFAACSIEANRVLTNDEKSFLERVGRVASLSNKF